MLKSPLYRLLAVLLGALLPLLLFEAYMSLALRFPVLCTRATLKFAGYIYYWGYREEIQFKPECARYDPELTYTLKPGACSFKGSEFETTVAVNSAGLRDDENSLVKPDIIVLGDSIAMGWGVDQDETYAQLIEKNGTMKVLNAGIASYGTVREMRLLDRLDTSNLKYLLIHYMWNDGRENKAFAMNRNSLTISSQDEYLRVRSLHFRRRRYFPFKYTLLSLYYPIRGIKARIHQKLNGAPQRPAEQDESPSSEARLFLNALLHASRTDLTGVRVAVISHEEYFLTALKEELATGDYPDHIREMTIIPIHAALTGKTQFFLDDHLRAEGHRIIAAQIHKTLPQTR